MPLNNNLMPLKLRKLKGIFGMSMLWELKNNKNVAETTKKIFSVMTDYQSTEWSTSGTIILTFNIHHLP